MKDGRKRALVDWIGLGLLSTLAALFISFAGYFGWTWSTVRVSPTKWTVAEVEMNEMCKALHRYAGEHGGRFPDSLEDISATYHGKMPRDPFSKLPFGYKSTGHNFELVCLGKDRVRGGEDPPDRDIVFTKEGRRLP